MNIHSVRYKRLETGLLALVMFMGACFVIIMAIFPEAFQNFRGRGSGWLHLLLTPIGRWVVLPLCAILSIYTGLAAVLRAAGQHKAIEVKASGLSVASLWSERHISWPEFERIQIESYQASKSSKPMHNLIVHWIESNSSKRKKIRIPLSLTHLPNEAIDSLVDAIYSFKSTSAVDEPRSGNLPIALANSALRKFGRKAI